MNDKLVFLIFQFRSTLRAIKCARIRQKRGTMIATITTIIAAYDNNDSGTGVIRRGITEESLRGGWAPRKDEERGRLMEVRNVFRRRQQVKW